MKYSPIRSANGYPLLTAREASFGLWGLATVFALFGYNHWQNPPPQPFTGRLAWFYKFAESKWGQTGPAWVIILFAALFFLFGLLLWYRAATGGTLDLRPKQNVDL